MENENIYSTSNGEIMCEDLIPRVAPTPIQDCGIQNIGKPTVPEISLLVDNTNVAVVDPWRKKFSNKFDLGKNRNLFPHQNVISNLHHPVPLSCKDLELSMCIPKSSTVPINTLPRTTIPSKLMDFSNETTPKCSIVTNNNAKCDSKTLRDIYDELLRQGKQPTQCAGEPNCEDLYAMLIDNRNEKQRTIPSNTAERSIQVETITAPKESGLHLPPDIMSFLENFKKSQETTLNEMRQQMYRQISTINEISGQTQSLIDFIATHQNVPKTTGIRSRFEIITEQSDDDEQTCSNGNVRANKYQNGNLQRNFCNQSNTSNGILKVKNDTPKSVTCTKKVLICPPKCQSATNSQTDVNAYDHHLTYDDDNKNQPCCCSKKMMHQCNVNDMTNNYSNPSDIVMVEKSVAWRIQDQTPRRQCQDRHIQLQTHPLQRLDDTENNAQVNGVGHTFYGNILGQVNDVLQNSPSSQAANISPAQQVHEIDGKLLHANETTGDHSENTVSVDESAVGQNYSSDRSLFLDSLRGKYLASSNSIFTNQTVGGNWQFHNPPEMTVSPEFSIGTYQYMQKYTLLPGDKK